MSSPIFTLDDAVGQLLAEQTKWAENDGNPIWGLDTGFQTINYATGGLHPGEVTILGARTSHGKSALANQIAFNVVEDLATQSALSGENVGQVVIVNPEMLARDIIMRRACSMSGVPSRRLLLGIATEREIEKWKAQLDSLRALDPHLKLIAGKSLSVEEVVEFVEQQHRFSGVPVKLVIVDYMQRLSAKGLFAGYDRTTEVSLRIKDMANTLEVPVMLLSQMKRDDKGDTEPSMFDIRESGRAEEDADNVWVLFRDKMLSSSTQSMSSLIETSPARIKIEKQRNGPISIIPLTFVQNLTLFREGAVEQVKLDGES